MSSTVPWHQSLAWRFFLRTALIILALVGSVLYVARHHSRQQAMAAAEAGIRVSARIMDRSFEAQARIMDAGLQVFTHTQQNVAGILDGDFTSVRESLLQNLSTLDSDVAMVIRPTGALLSCTTDGAKQDYTDVGIVALAMDPARAAGLGEPGPSYRGYFRIREGSFTGTYHGVARRVVARDGTFLGVMLVATRLNDATAAQLRQQSMVLLKPGDPNGHVALVAEGGLLGTTFTSESDARMVSGWAAGPGGARAREALHRDTMTQPIMVKIEGRDHLGMVSAMKGANARDLQLCELITVPLEPFLRPFQIIQRAVLWVGVAVLVLGLLLALSTARSVTAPLAGLTRAMAALADGERPEPPASTGRDEVGALSKGFCTLLGELKAKEDLLQALEHIRSARGSGPSPAALGATVDVDETVMLSGTSQTATAGPGSRRPGGAPALHKGDLIGGRYLVDKVLGTGGMGVVLKVRDVKLDEDVALKVIRPELGGNANYLEQLKQEIKLARRITHRYVLRTHDFGEEGGLPFVTMEYLHGVTLRQLLDDQLVLPFPLVLRIGRQVAEGLEAAHAEGVVHRDIKPQNVMFDRRGDVKLMDFGLAAPLEGRGSDADGQIFGTPRYMAPEQVRGEPVNLRTDLYGLGVMLFELASGFAPFQADDISGLLRMHLEVEPPDVRTLNKDLPEDFNLLLQRLLSKDKEDRPGSAGEVAQALIRLAAREA